MMSEHDAPHHPEPVDAVPAPRRDAPPRRWWPLIVVVAAILFAGVAVYLKNPEGEALFPKCVFHSATGLHCPGCGTARALHHLLHGRFLLALNYNVLAVTLLPVLLLCVLADLTTRTCGVRNPIPPLSLRIALAVVAVLLIFGILRNLPFWPWLLLAPPT